MAKIFLVEDDEITAEIVSKAFFDAGHTVGWLEDGQKALDIIRCRLPDAIILDQRMPGMPGMELLRELRRDAKTTLLPVMMLTAVSSDNDKSIAYYEGADDYLTKPFDPEILVFRVEELIGRSRRVLAS